LISSRYLVDNLNMLPGHLGTCTLSVYGPFYKKDFKGDPRDQRLKLHMIASLYISMYGERDNAYTQSSLEHT